MTQERIQKAAIETRCAVAMSLSGDGYSSVDLIPYIQDDLSYDDFIEESFAKGADWRINSMWHGAVTRPAENSKIVLIDKRGEWYNISYSFDEYDDAFGKGWGSCVGTYDIDKWAYVEDLLPQK